MIKFWEQGRYLTGWTLRLAELPHGRGGVTDFDEQSITVDPRLAYPAWRSSLFHEIFHARRRAVCRAGDEELLVEQMAAVTLLPLDDLRRVWGMPEREQARALDVDLKLLRTRVESLTKAELALLGLP